MESAIAPMLCLILPTRDIGQSGNRQHHMVSLRARGAGAFANTLAYGYFG
jgi:hypothetical protein